MSGWTKQKAHLKMLSNMKKEQNLKKDANENTTESSEKYAEIDIQCNIDAANKNKHSAKECVYATLTSGLTYTKAKHFAAEMDEYFVSESAFYEAQNQMSPAIKSYALESMGNARQQSSQQSKNGIIVSGDGRYPIKKNSPHCTFDVIDCYSNKILGLGVVDKLSYYHPNETFNQTSNMLESEAMRRAIAQLQEIKENIVGFSIDGDNKNKKILESDDFHPTLYRDPNHLVICFERYLDAELKKYKKMIPSISDCFRGVRDKIKGWYSYLIHSQYDTDIQKYAWYNTVEHLLGDHSNCIEHQPTDYAWITGINYPEAAVQLFIILEKRIDDFDLVKYNINTQKNESFHQVQLCYGAKNIRCPRSQETRDMLAVLRYNEGISFELELRKRLGLKQLSGKNQSIIQKMSYKQEDLSQLRKSPNFIQKKFDYRRMKSIKNKKQKGDYKPKNDDEEESSSE